MLITINILEGIRFYVSFACSFAFAELDTMEANAKMIALIARDENVHLAITQNILKLLPKDDIIYEQIMSDCEPLVYKMYNDAVAQEKRWAEYLFKDGSIIGLNAELLSSYVEYIANKRMKTIGLKMQYAQTNNPLSWTNKYLSSMEQQVAPQETENSSYLVGSIDNTMDENAFANFVL
jgi:ribonucleoside-diphosphate reductase beta chain